MLALGPHHRYSFADYLRLEATAQTRHEFCGGEIYAMAGGSPAHAALAAQVAFLLNLRLEGGSCRVFSSDLMVRVRETGLATYPDVTVVCGALELDPEGKVTVTNPHLLVEVTSESSEAYDRGEKLEHYMRIESLAAVLLVSHREPRLDFYRRGGDGGFTVHSAGAGETLSLPSLDLGLEVDRVYRTLPPDPA